METFQSLSTAFHISPKAVYRPVMDEQRFIDIETKISHQELLLEQLHQVLYKQQETIDQLQKKLKLLEDQTFTGNEIRPAGEKPPHY